MRTVHWLVAAATLAWIASRSPWGCAAPAAALLTPRASDTPTRTVAATRTPTPTRTRPPTPTPTPTRRRGDAPPILGCCDSFSGGGCVSPITERACKERGGTFVADAECDVRSGRCNTRKPTPTSTTTRSPTPTRTGPRESACCEIETELVALCLTGTKPMNCPGVLVPGGTCDESGQRCIRPTATPTPTPP